jgi:hypothetical protein
MVVSKEHFPSLLAMPWSHRVESQSIVDTLQEAWTGDVLVYAEHGSSGTAGTGPCIDHTHVNVIPGASIATFRLEDRGHTLVTACGLAELPAMEETYFLIGAQSTWCLYDSRSAPSQYLRMLQFEHYGLPHWDWRTLHNDELISKTLERWQHDLGERAS